jgi:hypothetical protein
MYICMYVFNVYTHVCNVMYVCNIYVCTYVCTYVCNVCMYEKLKNVTLPCGVRTKNKLQIHETVEDESIICLIVKVSN